MVDDDLDDTGLFCEALYEIDPHIICHVDHNARQALDKLWRNEYSEPDIIFIDVNMPGMNGWQCLEELKKDLRFREIPVIMYSTSSYAGDAERALELGALCFITKPSEYGLLKKILKAIADSTGGDISEAVRSMEGITANKIINCS